MICVLFVLIMSKKKLLLFLSFVICVSVIWMYISLQRKNKQILFSKKVKIALRSVGNELLNTNNDTTSLVLPIMELSKTKYQISFQNKLAVTPRNLIDVIDNNLKKIIASENYLIEVKDCLNKEVVYSYEMDSNQEKKTIACLGRVLPKKCYIIEVNFIKEKTNFLVPILGLTFLVIIIMMVFFYKKKHLKITLIEKEEEYKRIGDFKFYHEFNKLVGKQEEIRLSKKESEILEIFALKPNQIIKREELTKKVWEDKGVIVGRSLDTYISKLRKKLQTDNTIKLVNIHGIGYKLETTPIIH